MPELPEVEVVVRQLRDRLIGAHIEDVRVWQPKLRWPVDVAALQGLRGEEVTDVFRVAKYMVWRFASEQVLVSHLGMTGKFIWADSGSRGKHDHVSFGTDSGELRFNDVRRFGSIELCVSLSESTRLAGLAPDPLVPGAALQFIKRVAHRTQNIKACLLNGRLISGVGNIYACEGLYAARVSPFSTPNMLSHDSLEKLVAVLKRKMETAISAGGTTLRDFSGADGKPGTNAANLEVYGRESQPCFGCGGPILREVQTGRSTFWCPVCQSA